MALKTERVFSSQLKRARRQAPRARTETRPAMPPLEEAIKNVSVIELAFLTFLAVANDVFDWFGLDLLLFRSFDFVVGLTFAIWSLFRLKKTKKAAYGSLATFLIEAIPLIGDISTTWTFFMIYLWWLKLK